MSEEEERMVAKIEKYHGLEGVRAVLVFLMKKELREMGARPVPGGAA